MDSKAACRISYLAYHISAMFSTHLSRMTGVGMALMEWSEKGKTALSKIIFNRSNRRLKFFSLKRYERHSGVY
jgi:hypothetical protein